MSKRKLRFSGTNISQIQRYFAISMGALLVIFIVAQFVVLDLAGIHGPEITSLRKEQQEIKIDNDLKRAQINKQKTSQDILSYVENELGLVPAKVKTLQITTDSDSVTALE